MSNYGNHPNPQLCEKHGKHCEALSKEEINEIRKMNRLVELKVEESNVLAYIEQSGIDVVLFKESDCRLPRNPDFENVTYFTFDMLVRLVGMIKRNELILNPEL